MMKNSIEQSSPHPHPHPPKSPPKGPLSHPHPQFLASSMFLPPCLSYL